MVEHGLLIDYEYCIGCRECEDACRSEHGFPEERCGIKIVDAGPWEISEGGWQHDHIPVPTDQCDLCADRVRGGRAPSCVRHCQAAVMTYGRLDVLTALMRDKPKMVLFTPLAG